jgi:hypothetical protein
LSDIVRQYVDGLGLATLGGFEGHGGFDGAMLGHPHWPWHLEFTARPGHPVDGIPGDEQLLVFYLGNTDAWEAACARALGAGFRPVPAANPYWDRAGRTFLDLDGHRIVLQRGTWPPSPVRETEPAP